LSCAGADTVVVVVVLEVWETDPAKGDTKELGAGPLVTTVVVVVAGTLVTTGCEVVSAVLPDGIVSVQAATAASVAIGSSSLADRILMVVILQMSRRIAWCDCRDRLAEAQRKDEIDGGRPGGRCVIDRRGRVDVDRSRIAVGAVLLPAALMVAMRRLPLMVTVVVVGSGGRHAGAADDRGEGEGESGLTESPASLPGSLGCADHDAFPLRRMLQRYLEL
jgi:hypothetical protein